jgi:glutathione S-transferase
MIVIHHLGVSQSERIPWLCEELAVPYELKRYARDPVTRLAPASYRALHRVGTAPIITDGDLVLPESGAIIAYICAKYAGGRLLVPSSSPRFADFLFWFHFANSSMMPAHIGGLFAAMSDQAGKNPVVDSFARRKANAYAQVEEHLGRWRYFAGDEFSAADINMLFPMTTMRRFVPMDLAPFPNIRRYLQLIGERPAYLRAMAKSDPGLPLMLA